MSRRRRLAGTTWQAAWYWTLTSLLAVAAGELAVAVFGSDLAAPLRFIAAVSTTCPAVSILGAKRPHDQAWNFIVASLWLVLAMPAGKALLLDPGKPFGLHPAQTWFVGALVLVGLANVLPTRFWAAGLLFAAGQYGLLFAPQWSPLIGLALCVVATLLTAVQLTPRSSPRPWDRVWLDFRDLYGALWGLRLMERLNSVAQASGWDVRLSWWGFVDSTGPCDVSRLPPDLADRLGQAFDNLLRRFVTDEWIAARLIDTSAAQER